VLFWICQPGGAPGAQTWTETASSSESILLPPGAGWSAWLVMSMSESWPGIPVGSPGIRCTVFSGAPCARARLRAARHRHCAPAEPRRSLCAAGPGRLRFTGRFSAAAFGGAFVSGLAALSSGRQGRTAAPAPRAHGPSNRPLV